MSISGQVIDFYDDTDRAGLRKMAAPRGLGAAIFEVLSPDEREELHNDQFGLVVITKTAEVLRKFPLVDPPHVWLAGQYLALNHEKLAAPMAVTAARHIKLASDGVVELPPVIEELASQYPPGYEGNTLVEDRLPSWNIGMTKSAAAPAPVADDVFALVYQNGEGEIIRKYAMPNAVRTREAMDWFEKYAVQISPELRPQMARAIVKRATVLGIDMAGFEELPKLYQYAANGWNPHVHAHLEQRKSLLREIDDRAVETIDKLASAVGDSDPQDFARALNALDTKTNLRRYYDRGLEDAWSSSLGHEKTGEAWSSEVDGETVTESDLKKAASSPSFRQFFGDAVKTAFEKDPVTIFESLPAPNQAIIAQIARGEV